MPLPKDTSKETSHERIKSINDIRAALIEGRKDLKKVRSEENERSNDKQNRSNQP